MTMARWMEKLGLAGMAAGTAMMLQPWRAWGFRAGFFVVAAGTLLYIVASHAVRPEGP